MDKRIVSLFLLLLAFISVAGATTEIRVGWRVTDKQGSPLEGAEVIVIQDVGNETVAQGLTDANGEFFADLSSTLYYVVIHFDEMTHESYYSPSSNICYTVVFDYVKPSPFWLEYQGLLPYAAIGLITIIFVGSAIKVASENGKTRSERGSFAKRRSKAKDSKKWWRKVS